MRRLDIAGDDGGGIARGQHRAFGNDDINGLETACVHRYLVVDQRSEDVQNCGLAHRRRSIEIGRLLRARPRKVDRRLAPRLVDRDGDHDPGAAVHLVFEVAILEHVEHPADRFLGIVLHVLHVGAHHGKSEVHDHFFQLFYPSRAGRDLRPQVGKVLIDVATRVSPRGEDRSQLIVEEVAASNQLHVVEQNALLVDVR